MGSDAVPYADIVLLALIAGFILLRLRSILGNKNGEEKGPYRRDIPEAPDARDPIVQISEKILKAKQQPKDDDLYATTLENKQVASVIAQIKEKDPLFSATSFLSGAKMAYEMVFDAFAKGDKKTLEMLLSKDIYEHFASEIDKRGGTDIHTEITLVAVKPKDIVSASFDNNIARLAVKFEGEQISIERNGKNEIVGGDASAVLDTDDEWLFEKDITSKNPNWKIIET